MGSSLPSSDFGYAAATCARVLPIVMPLRVAYVRSAVTVIRRTLALPERGWFLGYGRYQPRTRRSAALHGASIGATLVGEILIGTGSPLAGVGALLTGATLDAAAADADRDSEAQRSR